MVQPPALREPARSRRYRVAATLRCGAGDDRAMKPLPASHLRIARPSHDLAASERFWADGLGLEVLFRAGSSAEGGHGLLMVGWPDAAWHLELVSDPGGETPAAPTEEDLLVLYLNGEVEAGVVSRLVDCGRHPGRRPQSILGPRGRHDRGPRRVPAGPDQPVLALSDQSGRSRRRFTQGQRGRSRLGSWRDCRPIAPVRRYCPG